MPASAPRPATRLGAVPARCLWPRGWPGAALGGPALRGPAWLGPLRLGVLGVLGQLGQVGAPIGLKAPARPRPAGTVALSGATTAVAAPTAGTVIPLHADSVAGAALPVGATLRATAQSRAAAVPPDPASAVGAARFLRDARAGDTTRPDDAALLLPPVVRAEQIARPTPFGGAGPTTGAATASSSASRGATSPAGPTSSAAPTSAAAAGRSGPVVNAARPVDAAWADVATPPDDASPSVDTGAGGRPGFTTRATPVGGAGLPTELLPSVASACAPRTASVTPLTGAAAAVRPGAPVAAVRLLRTLLPGGAVESLDAGPGVDAAHRHSAAWADAASVQPTSSPPGVLRATATTTRRSPR